MQEIQISMQEYRGMQGECRGMHQRCICLILSTAPFICTLFSPVRAFWGEVAALLEWKVVVVMALEQIRSRAPSCSPLFALPNVQVQFPSVKTRLNINKLKR